MFSLMRWWVIFIGRCNECIHSFLVNKVGASVTVTVGDTEDYPAHEEVYYGVPDRPVHLQLLLPQTLGFLQMPLVQRGRCEPHTACRRHCMNTVSH